jgi:hypothetical protein
VLLGYQVDGNGNILNGPGTHTYPEGSSGNVTNQAFGTARTHDDAQCAVTSDGTGIVTVKNGTTGLPTLPAGGTGSNAWGQGGSAIFNALEAFNNDPPAATSLVVSSNQVATLPPERGILMSGEIPSWLGIRTTRLLRFLLMATERMFGKGGFAPPI